MNTKIRKSIISFNEGSFIEAISALEKSIILKALLYSSEDDSLSFSFFNENKEMETAQINLIIEELGRNGIARDDYNIFLCQSDCKK